MLVDIEVPLRIAFCTGFTYYGSKVMEWATGWIVPPIKTSNQTRLMISFAAVLFYELTRIVAAAIWR